MVIDYLVPAVGARRRDIVICLPSSYHPWNRHFWRLPEPRIVTYMWPSTILLSVVWGLLKGLQVGEDLGNNAQQPQRVDWCRQTLAPASAGTPGITSQPRRHKPCLYSLHPEHKLNSHAGHHGAAGHSCLKTEGLANRDGKAPACDLKIKMVPIWLRCRNGKG